MCRRWFCRQWWNRLNCMRPDTLNRATRQRHCTNDWLARNRGRPTSSPGCEMCLAHFRRRVARNPDRWTADRRWNDLCFEVFQRFSPLWHRVPRAPTTKWQQPAVALISARPVVELRDACPVQRGTVGRTAIAISHHLPAARQFWSDNSIRFRCTRPASATMCAFAASATRRSPLVCLSSCTNTPILIKIQHPHILRMDGSKKNMLALARQSVNYT